jgi:uncharacterized membrane protein YebE (DUF533 family)|tara:strand:- start:146 stop:610 length:465 start_codon:yes stop_codon:yes gene_type:complete
MELDYKKLLLKTAVAAITSDGVIDDREIIALKEIEKSSPYFSEDDLLQDLESLLDEASKDINLFIENTILEISNSTLNTIEELTLLEVSLTIIEADDVIETSEKEFIIKLRDALQVDDFILSRRFGTISYLGIEYEKKSFEELDDESLTEESTK